MQAGKVPEKNQLARCYQLEKHMNKYNIERTMGNICEGQELIEDISKCFQNVHNKYRSRTCHNWSKQKRTGWEK